MIKGTGIDIESISRFERLPYGKNRKFYNKIYTQQEIAYCLKKKEPAQHFAARFSAKEAFIKAFPGKISDYRKIEITMRKSKPVISWKRMKVHLSLSHEKDKAVAIVVIE
ncbi:MAG: holo-ACP synthase [Nanoarchaeota archaeon]